MVFTNKYIKPFYIVFGYTAYSLDKHLYYANINQVVAHMMPDLPNVGLERDIEQFIVSVNSESVCT